MEEGNIVSLGILPYITKTSPTEVGENVFVLGFPFLSTMGEEVKLTNGIISAKTGFQGDITTYQISAPVQPGNSGGPLFDSKGNLIGVISSKHSEAQNASYGIKSSYLLSLMDLLETEPILPKTSNLQSKSLSEQVESIKKFVYIIEVN